MKKKFLAETAFYFDNVVEGKREELQRELNKNQIFTTSNDTPDPIQFIPNKNPNKDSVNKQNQSLLPPRVQLELQSAEYSQNNQLLTVFVDNFHFPLFADDSVLGEDSFLQMTLSSDSKLKKIIRGDVAKEELIFPVAPGDSRKIVKIIKKSFEFADVEKDDKLTLEAYLDENTEIGFYQLKVSDLVDKRITNKVFLMEKSEENRWEERSEEADIEEARIAEQTKKLIDSLPDIVDDQVEVIPASKPATSEFEKKEVKFEGEETFDWSSGSQSSFQRKGTPKNVSNSRAIARAPEKKRLTRNKLLILLFLMLMIVSCLVYFFNLVPTISNYM